MTKELLQQCLDALKSCRNVDQQWQIFDPQKVLKAVTDITVALAQQEQRSPNESELAALKADAERFVTLSECVISSDLPHDLGVAETVDEVRAAIDALKGQE